MHILCPKSSCIVGVSTHFGLHSTVRRPDLDLRLLFGLVLSPPGPHSALVHCYQAYRLVFNVCDRALAVATHDLHTCHASFALSLVHSTVTTLSPLYLHSSIVLCHVLFFDLYCLNPTYSLDCNVCDRALARCNI